MGKKLLTVWAQNEKRYRITVHTTVRRIMLVCAQNEHEAAEIAQLDIARRYGRRLTTLWDAEKTEAWVRVVGKDYEVVSERVEHVSQMSALTMFLQEASTDWERSVHIGDGDDWKERCKKL